MMKELQAILLSSMPLWITEDGYRQLMVAAFPMSSAIVEKQENTKIKEQMGLAEVKEYLKSHTFYQYLTHEALSEISAKVSQQDETKEINLMLLLSSRMVPSLITASLVWWQQRAIGASRPSNYNRIFWTQRTTQTSLPISFTSTLLVERLGTWID